MARMTAAAASSRWWYLGRVSFEQRLEAPRLREVPPRRPVQLLAPVAGRPGRLRSSRQGWVHPEIMWAVPLEWYQADPIGRSASTAHA
jgi:hypothetical protein